MSVVCIEGSTGARAGASAGMEASEEALALALRDPGNIIVRSSGFHQFLLI